MRLRVISWNVRGLGQNSSQVALLRSLSPDIVLLQDIPRSMTQVMRDNGPVERVLDRWSNDESGRQNWHRSGCLIAVAGLWQLTRRTCLPCSATGGCVLGATAAFNDLTLTLFSCYAPTNTKPLRAQRPAFFTALARQLIGAPTPLILGMDANGPRIDHPDLAHNTWWTPEESAVLGVEAPTLDVLRLWYRDHPEDFLKRCRYYPNGPLADSYHRGRKGKYLRSRYDSIRVSTDVRVVNVQYLYDDGIRAGSDHALVLADLELS